MSDRIAIVGAGQLGKMLCLAGVQQGLRFRVLDPASNPPASACAEHIQGQFDDEGNLAQLIDGAICATYEFENVPAVSAEFLESKVRTFPPAKALEISQDRLSEKKLFESLSIPTVAHRAVSSFEELMRAVKEIGFPSVLKTRRLGYDGKGQVVLKQETDIRSAYDKLAGQSLILEQWCPFDFEVSVIGVRGQDGQKVFYPPVRNLHYDGILRLSVPSTDRALDQKAQALLSPLLDELKYVGVLTLELFARCGELIANEMAPRVHNSGHWTIEGSETSQFENHLRACLGWPLGSTASPVHSLMVNLVGALPDIRSVRTIPGAHVHLYGKEPRAGRKIGHVTLCAPSREELSERLQALSLVLPPAPYTLAL